jgi:hypothetical protein
MWGERAQDDSGKNRWWSQLKRRIHIALVASLCVHGTPSRAAHRNLHWPHKSTTANMDQKSDDTMQLLGDVALLTGLPRPTQEIMVSAWAILGIMKGR